VPEPAGEDARATLRGPLKRGSSPLNVARTTLQSAPFSTVGPSTQTKSALHAPRFGSINGMPRALSVGLKASQRFRRAGRNSVGVEKLFGLVTQGSSFVATLGSEAESLRDSSECVVSSHRVRDSVSFASHFSPARGEMRRCELFFFVGGDVTSRCSNWVRFRLQGNVECAGSTAIWRRQALRRNPFGIRRSVLSRLTACATALASASHFSPARGEMRRCELFFFVGGDEASRCSNWVRFRLRGNVECAGSTAIWMRQH
jgi:hypothetical protein